MSRRVAVATLGFGVIGSVALLGAAAMRSCLATPERSVPIVVPAPKPVPPKPVPPAPRHHPGPCRELHDFKFAVGHVGADGIPDEIITWTYDAQGRPIREDSHRDDAPDRSTWMFYGSDGRLAHETFGASAGGNRTLTTHRYDAKGREIETQIDEDGKSWITYRTYDAAGRLATMREDARPGSRRGGVGHWYTYEHDRLVLEKVDNEGDGTPKLEIAYRYDDEGRLAEKHSHWYGKDRSKTPVDEVFTYRYRAGVTEETDRLGFTWVSKLDAADNLIEKVQEVPPQLADRTPMIRITYTYDCWQ